LKVRGDQLAISVQNVAEFWTVCTRPKEARGGYGLSPAQAEKRLRLIERSCTILSETERTYPVWRRLLSKYSVRGKQAHDTRLVAWMLTHQINHIITLNAADFTRYSEIQVVLPRTLNQAS
jgi:predicted nucleic acid-binding protein